MKKAESILFILSIISLGLNFLLAPGAGILTILTISTLSMVYFYFGFALFNDIRLREIFKKDSYKATSASRIIGAIGAGIALSITTIGLMFKFQSWPGANMILVPGLTGLIIVTVVGAINYTESKSTYYITILKRVAIFGGIGLVLFLIPKIYWVEFRYRNHPDYINAVKNSIANPDNKELQNKEKEELRKVHTNQNKD